MILKKKIHKNSPLNNNDYLEIIRNFKSEGTVIDDRGRNLIKTFSVKGKTINVKSFKIQNLFNQVVYKYFRKSKAQRSYEYANILKSKNIGTPQPYAYYEFFTPFGLQNSYYFSEHLNYDLTYFELRKSDPEYPDSENILRKFTQFTFNLHENGIFFKDHSHGNTLIVKNNKDYDFYLIDLNRMKFIEMDLDSRMKNFARLTEKEDMIEVMSDEYAKLVNEPYEVVHKKMLHQIGKFRKKFNRRKRFKEKFLGR